jgi:hypothetical protein
MDLLPLIATATGAIIALSGALLTEGRRDRQQRNREDQQARRESCVDFALALNAAHAGLRQVGDSALRGDERRRAIERTVHEADLFGARERLLMTATAPLVKAGETAFSRFITIRSAIRDGATTGSPEYHDAYHPFAEAVWQFRVAVRADFRQPALTPASIGKTGWSEREVCAECGGTRQS